MGLVGLFISQRESATLEVKVMGSISLGSTMHTTNETAALPFFCMSIYVRVFRILYYYMGIYVTLSLGFTCYRVVLMSRSSNVTDKE